MAFHPYGGGWNFLFDAQPSEYSDLRDSSFVPWIKWKKTGEKQPIWMLMPLTPTVVGVIYLLSWGLFALGHNMFPWYAAHVFTAYGVAGLVGIFATVDIMSAILHAIGDRGYANQTHGQQWGMAGVISFVVVVVVGFFIYMPLVVGTIAVAITITATATAFYLNNKTQIFTKILHWFDQFSVFFDKLFGINDYTEIRELLCPKDQLNLSTDINSIPKERRTWRLRYKNFKAKVCKPMQR